MVATVMEKEKSFEEIVPGVFSYPVEPKHKPKETLSKLIARLIVQTEMRKENSQK